MPVALAAAEKRAPANRVTARLVQMASANAAIAAAVEPARKAAKQVRLAR